jgi:CRISPR/Cas system CSM-associated protein Csm3 (group 7 of RAMP superfamily)
MPGREVARRVRWRGTLECRSPLHVGGLSGDDPDLPLALDGRGRPYVPGTSLAGAMRAWCERAVEADHREEVSRLFGGAGQHDEPAKPEGASRLFVEDAPVDGEAAPEVRDGVGIDRARGAAAEAVRYERMVLPRGSRLLLELTLELPADDRTSEPLVSRLLEAMTRGEVLLGAARSGGLGEVVLTGATWWVERLDTREGLLKLLRDGPSAGGSLPEAVAAWRGDLLIEVGWRPDLPVMLASGLVGAAASTVPLVTGAGPLRYPVLPGSSVKGVLRAHAERIVRTLFAEGAQGRLLQQVRVPLAEWLFGSDGGPARPAGESPAALGRAALRVADCHAEAVPADAWEAILQAGDVGELRDAMPKGWSLAHHVAIDRWTGGAADRFLFEVLEPWGLRWEPLRLEVERGRLGPDEGPCLALLLLVLRDLAQGRVALGWATRRGHGTVLVEEVTVTRRRAAGPVRISAGVVRERGLGELIGAVSDRDLVMEWQAWVERNRAG